jgi:hypothetical protein
LEAQVTTENQTPALSAAELAQVTSEAMRPQASKDSVELLGRRIPIRFMPVAKEERILELVEPYIPMVMGLKQDDLGGFAKLLKAAHRDLPKAVAIIAEPHLTLEEIQAEASTPELMAVVNAQLAKYGMQDALGKHSTLSALLGR